MTYASVDSLGKNPGKTMLTADFLNISFMGFFQTAVFLSTESSVQVCDKYLHGRTYGRSNRMMGGLGRKSHWSSVHLVIYRWSSLLSLRHAVNS